MNLRSERNLRVVGSTEAEFERDLVSNLYYQRGTTIESAGGRDAYHTLAVTVRDRLRDRRARTAAAHDDENPRFVYYLSAEYLLGRQLRENMLYTAPKTSPARCCATSTCRSTGSTSNRASATVAWLARNPNVTFHFTPVGSSWVNQIETWFGIITKQVIRRGTFTSVNALIHRIRAYAEQWNTDAEPFVWTATADEILAKVAWVETTVKQLVDNNAK